MTKKQVWQYQCDFCHKRGLSAGHMSKHEKYCTANPQRICRMHPHVTDEPQRTIPELIATLSSCSEDHGISSLREVAGGCPMCMLAAIRQSGIQKWDGDPESPPLHLGFNFTSEKESAWRYPRT